MNRKRIHNKTVHVTTYMRANPLTRGHELVFDTICLLAANCNADSSILLSHSYDGRKNPLTQAQKAKYAKKAFPKCKIEFTSYERPSFMYYLSELYANGVKELHFVAGIDRVSEFQKLIEFYNGVDKPHGYFNFTNTIVHCAGYRNDSSEVDIHRISGTAMRRAACNGDRKEFHTYASSRLSKKLKDDMYRDTVKGLVA